MRTVDRVHIRAPLANVYTVASDVSRWPAILPRYRWVRFLERRGEGGVVEMAARRPFGPLAYPAWWVSEMAVDRPRGEIRYRHLRGITTGMDVVWRLAPSGDGAGGSTLPEGTGPGRPPTRAPAPAPPIGPGFFARAPAARPPGPRRTPA